MSRQPNRAVRAELSELERLGVVSREERLRIAERYPVERWDLLALVRWLTILGAVAAGIGALLMAREWFTGLRLAEVASAAVCIGLIGLGRWVGLGLGLAKTRAALELCAGFALQGFITLLALDFSTGGKNWPLLVGVQAALLTGLSYALQNRLVLVHACVCLFVFFGGETGYVSGWGAYWLGMSYPLRFVAAGAVSCGVAFVHAFYMRSTYQAFARVYAHFGLLSIHLALWFFAVFGYFDGRFDFSAGDGERALFSALWAAVSLGSIWLAGRWGQPILRSYGLTFLILDLYTFYFQFVVAHSSGLWWLHLLVTGASLMGWGVWLERRVRERRSTLPPQTQQTPPR